MGHLGGVLGALGGISGHPGGVLGRLEVSKSHLRGVLRRLGSSLGGWKPSNTPLGGGAADMLPAVEVFGGP